MLDSHLPPPAVYLFVPKMGRDGKWWYFTDVEMLNQTEGSSPDVQPMRGNRAPLVTEGHGNGLQIQVMAHLNSWHQFLSSQQTSAGSGRAGNGEQNTPYQDYLEIMTWYNNNSPSPEVIFIQDGRPARTMIMTELTTNIHLGQSVPLPSNPQTPSSIAMMFNLVERHPYKVVVN